MSFIELLRNARTSRVSVLHKFLTHYNPNSQRVFAFVEGEPDQPFYRAYLRHHVTDASDVLMYNCEGKEGVYALYKEVTNRYPECRRVLFFVDKDIDEIVGITWPSDPRIFATEWYSVENYVICRESLAYYFSDYVKVRRVEISNDSILSQFDAWLTEFHKDMLVLMAWVTTMRRAGQRICLNDVNMNELFTLSDSGLRRRSNRVAYLVQMTGCAQAVGNWRTVRATCRELKRLQPKSYIRGKFEAWWFVEFGKRMIEALDKVVTEGGGSLSVRTPLNISTFVQLLAPVVPLPKTLEVFLCFHLSQRPTTTGGVGRQEPETTIFNKMRRLLGHKG